MTLTLKIAPALDARLAAEARRRRVSKSQVAREAIEVSLSRKPKARATAYDMVKHLVGSVKGPADLSTNPKHMEGFGA